MPLQKTASPGYIPPVLDKGYVYKGDWDFDKKGDSAIVQIHALARELRTCSDARCPGNQVVRLRKGAKAYVIDPDGVTYVYRLNEAPNKKAPSKLPPRLVSKLRNDFGARTLTVAACNPVTFYNAPVGYKHTVVAPFTFVKEIAPTMSM